MCVCGGGGGGGGYGIQGFKYSFVALVVFASSSFFFFLGGGLACLSERSVMYEDTRTGPTSCMDI